MPQRTGGDARPAARPTGRVRRRAAAALLPLAALTGCAPTAAGDRLDVWAASSLAGVLPELAAEYERAHPGTEVALNFSGSSDLAVQIAEGAPADLFVAADEHTLQRVLDAGRAAGPARPVATNRLVIAVAEGNPRGVGSLADLAGDGVRTVVCAEQVPCGHAARTVQDLAGVDLRPVSEENAVTDVLGKVRTGQADAGLVYVTDVAAHEDELDAVALPEAAAAANPYAAVVVPGGEEDAAAAFAELLTGPAGRERLAAAGFGPPPAATTPAGTDPDPHDPGGSA